MRGSHTLLLFAALLLTAACGDSGSGPPANQDTIPPAVIGLEPAPGATGVPAGAIVEVWLSEPINWATVGPGSFLMRRGSDTVPGDYGFGDSSVTFSPTADLARPASYSVFLGRGIRDPAGNQLVRDTSWGFQTAPLPPPVPPR